ncbi:MAG: hypothetical protein COB00_03950 [Alcanivorax sp.]|nr:MAG: hypothetical protein COB00_03950 [Alcanivorax sp.]
MKRNERILLLGYYGMSNFGDDLFVKSAEDNWSKILGKKNVFVLGPEIEGVMRLSFLVPKCLKSAFQKKTFVGSVVRILFLILGVFWCGKIVFWGGSVFTETSFGFRHKILFMLNKMRIIRLFAFGVSVGPFGNSEKKYNDIVSFVKSMEFIGCRDVASERSLESISYPSDRYKNIGDLAYYTSVIDIESKGAEKKNVTVGISLCKYESYVGGDKNQEEKFILRQVELISIWCSMLGIGEAIVFCLNADLDVGDIDVSKKMKDELSRHKIKSSFFTHRDVSETVTEIARTDFFISMRLHGGICAHLLSIPFVLYEYHPKCTDFIESISYSLTRWKRHQDFPSGEKINEDSFSGVESAQDLSALLKEVVVNEEG